MSPHYPSPLHVASSFFKTLFVCNEHLKKRKKYEGVGKGKVVRSAHIHIRDDTKHTRGGARIKPTDDASKEGHRGDERRRSGEKNAVSVPVRVLVFRIRVARFRCRCFKRKRGDRSRDAFFFHLDRAPRGEMAA